MVIIPTLKHNKTVQVDVPKPAELYKRLGFNKASVKYSGDEVLSPNESKIDQVQKVAAEAFMSEKESE